MTSSASLDSAEAALGLAEFAASGWFVASAQAGEVAAAAAAAREAAPDGLLLRTCQRIEAYGFAPSGEPAPFRWQGFEALLHLAEVAGGLHSAVLGEREVLGQARAAIAAAPPSLRRPADIALASARQLRREERLSGDAGALFALCLEFTGTTLPKGRRALVLGGGVLAAAVARSAHSLGFEVTIGLRDTARAPSVPGGVAVHWLAGVAELPAFDVIAGCVGDGDDPVALPPLPPAPLLLDLATPRNFESVPPGATVVRIVDLVEGESGERAARRAGLRRSLATILARRLEDAAHTHRSPIGQLRLQVERQRAREAERIRRLHPEIPSETVEVITQAMVNRLFHRPSLRLKSVEDPEFSRRVAALFAAEEGVTP